MVSANEPIQTLIIVPTLDQAMDIYRRDYWQPASCDRMPERIGHPVFDCAVHHGVKTAIAAATRAESGGRWRVWADNPWHAGRS